MTIKKKLTKRQILNELLLVEEQKAKYEESLKRVYARGEKLTTKFKKLSEQLETITYRELKATSVYPYTTAPEPILYKGHVFSVSHDNWGKKLEIVPVKVIK